MPIKCPCCHQQLRLRELNEGKFSPRCPKCGDVFVMRVQVMSTDSYKSYRSKRRAGIDALRKLKLLNGKAAYAPKAIQSGASDENEVPVEISNTLLSNSSSNAAEVVANETNGVATSRPLPESLGGYKIVKELGHGGMGSVYLAKQISLNRNVAIKTIRSQYARNPAMLSRFTREAYAAAQLTHHNIVQVYDLSEHKSIHFFSMEYVEGIPLDRLLQEKKLLDTRDAVGYVLQAARGLLFAHEHGMVHRDVKPANLLLNRLGIVKVADLGLVKTRDSAEIASSAEDPALKSAFDSHATMAGESLGSPAFMAPEQCDDAAAVDHRADIYSLGCTMYMLLTGQPPFQGRSSQEVMNKHKNGIVQRPEKLVSTIPPIVSTLTMKMLAKRRDERPADLQEVISQLELQLEQSGSPVARFADALQGWMQQYHAPKLANLRPRIILLLYCTAAFGAVYFLAQLNLIATISLICIPLFGSLAYIIAVGMFYQSYILQQVRRLVFESRWLDYGIWILTAVALVGAIAITKMVLVAIIVTVVGFASAIGFYFGIDRLIHVQRSPAVAGARSVIRQMRLEGMDETTIHRLTAEGCGENWEEFFECLFGYPAKRDMRKWLENERSSLRTRKHAAWRDKLVDAIQARLDQLEQTRQRARVHKLELARLTAEGLTAVEARKQATDEAQRMVEHIAALRSSAREFASANADRRRDLKQMIALARAGKKKRQFSIATQLSKVPMLVLGGRSRFALGAVLLTLGMLWLQHNHVFDDVQKAVSAIEDVSDLSKVDVTDLGTQLSGGLLHRASYVPLPYLPGSIGLLLGCIGASVAGLLLLITSPCGGLKGTLLAFFSAAIAIMGPALLADYLPEISLPIPFLQAEELAAFTLAIATAGLSWRISD